MNKSPIVLSFQCQKKWETMSPEIGGRFCSSCNKTVADFSKVPINQLSNVVPESTNEHACGHFRAYQLNKPFGNWKDKIISTYQVILHNRKTNNLSRKIILLFVTIALIATGCHRHLRGKFRADNSFKKKKQDNTEQATSQAIEEKSQRTKIM